MPQAASFEDFLRAPARLAEQKAAQDSVVTEERAAEPFSDASSRRDAKYPKASSRKVKVGLTIDADIVDAVDDYIYYERKQGRRLKKNDVYEAALRQFLGLKGDDAR